MDLIEIDYHDCLAEFTADVNSVSVWFAEDNWENYVMSYTRQCKKDEKIPVDNIQLTVGNDLISLSEGVYEKEPYTSTSHFGGRLATLAMLGTIFIRDGKLKGKMRIHNASKQPIDTNYELLLKNAEMKMLVGLKICGEDYRYDNCKYKFVKSDLSFKYIDNSKEMSVFNRETDSNKRKLLEQYMVEYITKKLCLNMEEFQLNSIDYCVSESLGLEPHLKNMLSIHNKIMRKAFKNLSDKIISIANSLLVKRSPKLKLTELFGIIKQENEECNLKVYSGYIDQLDSLAFSPDKNAIISNEGDLVIVHVPVEFRELKLHITELADGSNVEHKEQTYETSGSHFIMSLKRLSDNEAKINLLNFKVMNITPTSEIPISVVMDHLITFAIEQHVKPFLEEAMTKKELQELAIKPDVEIEYDRDDDLMGEDSENEQ